MKSSSDESWAGMLARVEVTSDLQRKFGPEQAQAKVLEYLKREIHAKGICGVREVLMHGENIQTFPRIKIVIGDREEFLLTTTGLTVGEVRTSREVPTDWTAFVNDKPVTDDYPILRDCVVLFQLAAEKTMAGVCRSIRSAGYCQQREDSQNWISIGELRTTILDETIRMLSEKELRTLLRHEGIRTRKPSRQRLQVNCGDWLHFLAQRAQQEEQLLDAAADQEKVKPVADDIMGVYERLHRRNQDSK